LFIEAILAMIKKILIVGAGFSGAVCARQIANNTDSKILIIDKRNHIAGNCYTSEDAETGITEHIYGPHIFHTNNEKVWDYVNKYAKFNNFINRVKSSSRTGIYSMPINLHTINQFYDKKFSPEEACHFIKSISNKEIIEPKNFEEQALKFVGEDLYYEFFYGYTKKQWGVEPSVLPASILKRLPLRFDYNDNYYNSLYQGIPLNGYTELVNNILNHESIEVNLGKAFKKSMINSFDLVIYTGAIDSFFDFKYGRLGYRTVFWKKEYHDGDYQGCAVMNYPDEKIEYTRIHEHKHFAPEKKFEKTFICKEFSKETGKLDEPFYPKRLPSDMNIFNKYKNEALDKSANKKVGFIGRLATYRYMDMHNIIDEAISFGDKISKSIIENKDFPVFPEGV
jgi:UDP-galactopyranose mutase